MRVPDHRGHQCPRSVEVLTPFPGTAAIAHPATPARNRTATTSGVVTDRIRRTTTTHIRILTRYRPSLSHRCHRRLQSVKRHHRPMRQHPRRPLTQSLRPLAVASSSINITTPHSCVKASPRSLREPTDTPHRRSTTSSGFRPPFDKLPPS